MRRHDRPQPGAGRDIQRPTEPLSTPPHAPESLSLALERDIEPGAVIGHGQHEPGSFDPATNLHGRTAGMSGGIVHAFLEDQEHIPSNVDAQSQRRDGRPARRSGARYRAA